MGCVSWPTKLPSKEISQSGFELKGLPPDLQLSTFQFKKSTFFFCSGVRMFVCLGPVERTVNNFPFSWGRGKACVVSKNQTIAPEFISKKTQRFFDGYY